jgi:hypothetical protein
MTEDWPREARARLLARPEPGGWIGIVVKAIDAREHELAGARAHTPPHYLVGAWAPGPDGLYPRLPEFAAIASPDGARALRELFAHLPAGARIHLADERVADAALLAEMVLVCDRNLEDWQREALERFALDRRAALRVEIAQRYTDREGGFERFRDRLLDGDR